MVEELSFSDRLRVLKRLLGLRSARFVVFLDEHDRLYVNAATSEESDPSSDIVEELADASSEDIIRFRGRSYRLPSADSVDASLQRYFG